MKIIGKNWGKIVLLITMMTMIFNSSASYVAAEELYPFVYERVENYLSDIWVGDTLSLEKSYTYDVIEGADKVELSHNEHISYLHFIETGIVKMRATRLSDNVQSIIEFKINPPKRVIYKSLINNSIKIGEKLPGAWFSYSNCFLQQCTVDIKVPTYDEYCLLPGQNYGYGVSHVSREVESCYVYTEENEWQWLFGVPTKPGKLYYTTELEPDKQYAVEIESPVIETNLPKQIIKGSELEFKTLLKNTALSDKKIEIVKSLIAKNENAKLADLIGYQPRVEIVSGADLIKRDDADYSNILSTSEKITFEKEGTVVLRVVYEMIPITNGEHRIFKTSALYSPEQTFSIKVVSEDKIEETKENIENKEDKEDNKTEPTIDSNLTEGNKEVENTTEQPNVEMKQEVELDYTNVLFETEDFLNELTNLMEKEKVSINVSTNIIIDEKILSELVDGKHEFVLNNVNEAGEVVYSWSIENVTNTDQKWNTGINIGTEVEQITDLLNEIEFDGNSMQISFEHDGVLPGKASVQLFIGDKYKNGEKVFYYYHNQQEKVFEIIGEYTVDENGYVKVEMEHCSDYILTNKTIEAGADKDSVENDTLQDYINGWIICGMCVIAIVIFALLYVTKRKRTK